MKRFEEDNFGIPWLMDQFHRDWMYTADSEEGVIRYVLGGEMTSPYVLAVKRDAEALLARLSSKHIEALWDGGVPNGNFFAGRVYSGSEWMRFVIGHCDDWLARNGITQRLNETDLFEGGDLGPDVMALIREIIGRRDARMDLAFEECVGRCSPDLGFRCFVQYLIEGAEVRLTPLQYLQLERLGERFNYGRYLVSRAEFLVDRP